MCTTYVQQQSQMVEAAQCVSSSWGHVGPNEDSWGTEGTSADGIFLGEQLIKAKVKDFESAICNSTSAQVSPAVKQAVKLLRLAYCQSVVLVCLPDAEQMLAKANISDWRYSDYVSWTFAVSTGLVKTERLRFTRDSNGSAAYKNAVEQLEQMGVVGSEHGYMLSITGSYIGCVFLHPVVFQACILAHGTASTKEAVQRVR